MRDKDVFDAIRAGLMATGEFTVVTLYDSTPSSSLTADAEKYVRIWPIQEDEPELYDSPRTIDHRVSYSIVVGYRAEDPEARGRELERLRNVIRNFLNGDRSIGGQVWRHETVIPTWTLQPTKHPESSWLGKGKFGYGLEGDAELHDATPELPATQ